MAAPRAPASEPPERPASGHHLRGLGCIAAAGLAIVAPLVVAGYLLHSLLLPDGDRVRELDEEEMICVFLRPGSAVSTRSLYLDPEAPLLFGCSDAGGQALFLRFPIELPTRAEVAYADIVFRCADNLKSRGEEPVECKIEALDADDQPPYTGRRYQDVVDLQQIPRLEARSIHWRVDPWRAGESYATVNLASLIEAFLARPGYRPGNSMGLVVRGVGASPGDIPGESQLRSVAGAGSGAAPFLRVLLAEPQEE